MLSSILGVGGGIGIVLGGLIIEHLNYHWLYWIPLVVTVVAAFCTWRFIPESPVRVPGRVNWLAAALMSGGFICVLIAISETITWGWGSAKTLGLLAVGLLGCVAWVAVEVRSDEPLIDMTMMRIRGVWTTNLVAFLLGAGMYASFLVFPQFAQLPKSTGFGFGASVVTAGLYLLPAALLMSVLGTFAGRVARRFGSKLAVIVGSAVTAVAFGWLAVAHGHPYDMLISAALLGIGIGLAFSRSGQPDRAGRARRADRRRDRHEHRHAHARRRARRPDRRHLPGQQRRPRQPDRDRVHRVIRARGGVPGRRGVRRHARSGRKSATRSRRLALEPAARSAPRKPASPMRRLGQQFVGRRAMHSSGDGNGASDAGPAGADPRGDRYKWIALSNCTLGVLLATLDASITLIAMPDIFRGIQLDPLVPANSFYLLWMILGFLVVSSVLIVSLGRLGDMYGRVRIYNLGFVIYTAASLFLTVDWLTGRAGATFLIVFRIVQGIGAACLLANSAAIITDAFPPNQRGMALGINNIVGVSGMFVGLVLGGLLAPISWRMVFLISVPVGLFGTVWAYLKLEERSKPRRAPIDWAGNLTFALGLILIMVSVTYGIRPYGHAATGWGSPRVIALLVRRRGLAGRLRARSSAASGTRCSACRCSGSAPSPSARCRRSCRPSPAAA